jgi:alkylation response protein AidB-like acyl-CoA dehydrogenase
VAEVAVSYAPTEETELLRSTARQYLEDRLGLGVVRETMMSEDGFDRAVWREIADMGWTGLTIPEEHGGAGYGPVEMSVLLEEMGRLVTPGPFFASVVLATTAISELGTPDQRAELLPDLASGETLATLAFHEGPRDWGLERLATTVERNGDGWVVSGVKNHVLDGHLADLLLVVAPIGDQLGVFAVETRADGVEVIQTPVLDPTRRQAQVRLDRARVAGSSLLGDSPSADGVRRVLALGSAALAVEQVGGAQRCLDTAVEYARTRHQFGRPIGSFQAIKHRCAEMLMRVEHARSTAYHAARVTDQPEEFAIASPLAASVSSESYVWAAGENIQIHGGIGFTWEHDAHLYLKRAKSSALLLGDPRHHRRLLANALGLVPWSTGGRHQG